MPRRGYLRLWTPRARATDLGQGPHLRYNVRASSLRAPEPRAREKTHDRKGKKCRCANKTNVYLTSNIPGTRYQVLLHRSKAALYRTWSWWNVVELGVKLARKCTTGAHGRTHVLSQLQTSMLALNKVLRLPHSWIAVPVEVESPYVDTVP